MATSSSDVVDVENQQTPIPAAFDDQGSSWLTCLFKLLQSFIIRCLLNLHLLRTTKASGHEKDNVISEQLISSHQIELELARTAHLAPASPDHDPEEFKVNVKGEDDSATNEAKIHQLGTIAKTVTITQAQTPSFFKLLLDSCLNWTVFLLLVCVILTTVFGIQQEGTSNGWLEGAVGMFALNILVFVPTFIKYFSVPRKMNATRMKIKVYRGENLIDVSAMDIALGDIVWLEPGSVVPADGLFISPGGPLEVEDGAKLPTVDESNPSLVYGAKVVSGNGRMLVTCVGMKTALGDLLLKVKDTPKLQDRFLAQLDNLTTKLQIQGLVIAIIITLVLIIRSEILKENNYPGLQADQLKGKTASSEALIDVIRRFFVKSKGRFGVLATYLPLLIVGLSEGVPFSVALANAYWNFKAKLSGIVAIARTNLACFVTCFVSTLCIGGELTLSPVLEVDVGYVGNRFVIDADGAAEIDQHVREALYKGIAAQAIMSASISSCTSTENQYLLQWASSTLGLENETALRIDEEANGVMMKDIEAGDACLYWSGPAATIVSMCSEYYDSDGTKKPTDEQKKHDFEEIIRDMHSKHLNAVAYAHKKIDELMPEEDESLTLIALLGVKDSTGTVEALEVLRKAGVDIIVFADNNEADKLRAVQRMKDEGRVVAVVGAKTNEIPAIKEADVGIAMGTSISELVREGSDLIIHSASLGSLIDVIRTGRCIFRNIQKYIQVELTANISLLLTILVTTTSCGHYTIGAIEALWATLLVTLCTLALLVEQPTKEQMENKPIKQNESLISKHMWRNILLQVLYQASMLAILQFKLKPRFDINEKKMESIVFSGYVLCQVFNLVSSREPEKKNVFRGIHRSRWIWVAVVISVAMQVTFVKVAHEVAGDASLDWGQWGFCLLVAMGSWLIDLAGKCAWNFTAGAAADIGSTSISSPSLAASESTSSQELLINVNTEAHQSSKIQITPEEYV